MAIAMHRAIGVNARYVIGIWTGRPDRTPVVGQFGFASAVPLLTQVNNLLLSRGTNQPEDPRPDSVSRGVVCWPGGQSLAPGGNNCRRRLATFGYWMAVSRQRYYCPSRKGLMAFVFLSGWMMKATCGGGLPAGARANVNRLAVAAGAMAT